MEIKTNKAMARTMWNSGKEFWVTKKNTPFQNGVLVRECTLKDFNGDFDRMIYAANCAFWGNGSKKCGLDFYRVQKATI